MMVESPARCWWNRWPNGVEYAVIERFHCLADTRRLFRLLRRHTPLAAILGTSAAQSPRLVECYDPDFRIRSRCDQRHVGCDALKKSCFQEKAKGYMTPFWTFRPCFRSTLFTLRPVSS